MIIPDFELEIVANEPIPISSPNVVAGFAAVKHTFYPKLVTQETVLPGILQAYGGKMPSAGFCWEGCIFVLTGTEHTAQVELWETVIGMESFIDTTTTTTTTTNNNKTIQVPLHKHKDCMGHLLLQVQVTLPLRGMQQQNTTDKSWSNITPPDDGLVSLVGMDCLSDGLRPALDCLCTSESSPSLRQQQLSAMGYFFTTQYLEQQLA
jgi:hypothetical protein